MNAGLGTFARSVRTIGSELWSDGRGWILIAVSTGWTLSIGIRFVYPALASFLRDEFHIGLATTGLLLTALWGSYALGHVPGGILGDNLGEGRVLVLSTAIAGSSVLVVSAAVSIPMLFVGTIAFGLATALYGPNRFTILTDIYDRRAGTAVGLTMAAGSLGNAIFPALAVSVATVFSWRYGFGMFLPAFVLTFAYLWLALPSRTSEAGNFTDKRFVDNVSDVLSGIQRESIPSIVSIHVCLSIIMQGFSSFYPLYLSETKAIGPGVAASLFGLFFAFGVVIQPVSGTVLERLGTRTTLGIFLGATVVGLWLLPFVEEFAVLILVTGLVSCWNGCGVITQTYIANTLPPAIQGTGFGTVKAGWMLIGAIAPLSVGLLADAGLFDLSFVLLAVVGTVGLALLVMVGDT